MERDSVEAVEVLHAEGGGELHFRFIGYAQNRSFIVNVQFGILGEDADEPLRPKDYGSVMQKILHLISEQLKNAPNPALR